MPRLLHLWAELRRRRVPQVVGFYLLAAFTALQAAESLTGALTLPAWIPTVVAVLAIAGIPVVAALAWVFDLRDGRVHRTEAAGEAATLHQAPGTAATEQRAAGRGRTLAWGLVILALAAVAGWSMVSRPQPPALDDALIAVVPFRASGDATVAGLDQGMVDLLAAKLTGEGGIRALEPRAVLAAWGRAAAEDDEERRAGAVARELGAARVLLGSVVGSSGRVLLSGRVVDAATGQELARTEADAPVDSLPDLVDAFAGALLGRLGGVEEERLRLLGGTPVDALEAYLQGQAALRAGDFDVATEHFRDALDADSTFAPAGLYHRTASGFTFTSTDAGLFLAWRHRHRLPPRDRLYARAVLGENYPEWTDRHTRIQGYRRLTAETPDRAEAWYELADYVLHSASGQALPARVRIAREAFERAVAIDSSFQPAAFHLIDVALMQDDTAAALRAARQVLATGRSDGLVPAYARWITAILEGRTPDVDYATIHPPFAALLPSFATQAHGYGTAEAHRAADAFVMRPDVPPGGFSEARRYALERGRLAAASDLADREQGAASADWTVERLAFAIYGDLGASLDTLAATAAGLEALARDARPGTPWEDAACVAAHFRLAVGQPDSALALVAGLRTRVDEGDDARTAGSRGAVQRFVASCEAAVDAAAAADVVDPAAPEYAALLDRLDRFHGDGTMARPWLRDAGSLLLARMHERRGDLELALDASRRRVVGVPNRYFLAAQLRAEGDLAARLGRTREAVRAYRRYLELRSDADSAVATLVDDVAARLQSLTGEVLSPP